MKSSLRITWFLMILFLISAHLELKAQMPQGFKYQTIVRDNGLAVANEIIPIRLSILSGGPSGAAVYVETQNPLASPLGVVSLMVGQGTPSAGTFSQIDWSSGNFYLQVEVDVHGTGTFSLMGSSQLVSVPYALYAQSSGASQWLGDSKSLYTNGSVGIRGPIDTTGLGNDTILFEVQDRNHKPVFRVLESGVRIFVESGSKGAKGGFSVGGRSAVKGGPADLLWVTNDSIRLYVDDPGTKGAKGGFAVGGRSPGVKGASVDFVHLTPFNYFIGQYSGINNNGGTDNLFLGNSTGFSNITGSYNIFMGNTSGYSNSDGIYNVFIGRKTGYNNENGSSNIFIGDYTGWQNTSGASNVYIGDFSGAYNQTGSNNVFLGASSGNSSKGTYDIGIGSHAGSNTQADSNNIFIGYYAGAYNQTGNNNIFMGSQSGENNLTGTNNVFLGTNTGTNNQSGYDNIFMGNEAGNSNNTGYHNIFLGYQAGYSSTAGNYNNLVGTRSGNSITTGSLNNFMGDESGRQTTTGSSNVFLGDWAGRDNTDGGQNVYLGADAGLTATGSGNIFIGSSAGRYETGSNKLFIANSSADNTAALVYGEFDNQILRLNANVGIGNTGFAGFGLVIGNSLSTYTYSALYAYGNISCSADMYATYFHGALYSSSDIRYKTNIFNLPTVTEKVMSLKPITYDWKDEKLANKMGRQIGLIAQEVEVLFPEIVNTDEKGFKSMDYSKLSVILIQAFKEQQQIVLKQSTDLENAQKSISALTEENKVMKLQLQKLNDMQIELDKIKAAIGMPVEK